MSKTVLVTGGLGFVGSNLVDILYDRGYEVWVIDNLISESARVEYKRQGVNYIIDDAVHVQEWNHELPGYIDTVFHLGALARIQPSFKNPNTTVRNNVITTSAVCEFARHRNAKIVYAGSSSFYYGTMKNPYTFSKWQGEQVCGMYNKVYGLDVSVARFFNVYGSRQPTLGQYGTVIGIFIRQYNNGEDLTVVGTGEKRRDFTHVGDICNGLIALSKTGVSGIYNLGTGTNFSINEVADMVIEFGDKSIKKKYIPERPGEAQVTLADISKTTEDTGWTPRYSLRDYLRETINV